MAEAVALMDRLDPGAEETASEWDVPEPHKWDPQLRVLFDDLEKTKRALKLLTGHSEADLGDDYGSALNLLRELEIGLKKEIATRIVSVSAPALTETG